MRKEEPKIYLFIIWEKSRNKTEQILDDLREKFVIRDVYEVKWSKGNFLNNLKRFYGQSLPDAQQKAEECGTGPFLLIIVSDPHPEFVEPSKSGFAPKKDLVNTNIGDSKEEYRKWVGKEFTVHSSVSENETNHNSTLLFGKNTQDFEKDLPEKWTGSIKNLESDLIGHDGWKDMKQLLYVMNGTLNYVILRNFEGMPAEFDYHDVDILVNDEKLPYIADKDFSPFKQDDKIFFGWKKQVQDWTDPTKVECLKKHFNYLKDDFCIVQESSFFYSIVVFYNCNKIYTFLPFYQVL